jgi:hypothetical protein
MMSLKWMTLCAFALMATAVCSAQQKFPLRSGEWEATAPAVSPGDTPTKMLYCLNDELWQKALTENPSCSIQQFNVTSSGASYFMDCKTSSFQMKGKVVMTFDGMLHIIAKAALDATVNGTATHTASTVDYRWKGATCSPNDMNLKNRSAH